MHTVSGKDTFETDRITSVLTVLYHGFHTSILVSLFLNETETVVKKFWILIGLRAKSKPRASSEMRMSSVVTWVFPRIAPLRKLLTGGGKAVHVNRKRFSAESNLIYRIDRPAEGVHTG